MEEADVATLHLTHTPTSCIWASDQLSSEKPDSSVAAIVSAQLTRCQFLLARQLTENIVEVV